MMQSSPLNYRRVVILIGRLLLGVIFVYAGYSKVFTPNFIPSPMFALRFSILTNLSSFATQVQQYELLSPGGVSFVAHTLPFAEIILGLLLLVGWQVRIWASLISLLLLGFVAVVSRAYFLHMNIDCGCFATREPLTGYTVLRDAALTVFALVVTVLAFLEARRPHPWTASAPS